MCPQMREASMELQRCSGSARSSCDNRNRAHLGAVQSEHECGGFVAMQRFKLRFSRTSLSRWTYPVRWIAVRLALLQVQRGGRGSKAATLKPAAAINHLAPAARHCICIVASLFTFPDSRRLIWGEFAASMIFTVFCA